MIRAPGLVQGSDRISDDDLVADKADIAKELMVVGLTVRQALKDMFISRNVCCNCTCSITFFS